MPLIRPETIASLVTGHVAAGAAATVLTAEMADPTGYGRVLRDERGRVVGVVEQGDAAPGRTRHQGDKRSACTPSAVTCYPPPSTSSRRTMFQGEYYLTDVVSVLAEEGHLLGGVADLSR